MIASQWVKLTSWRAQRILRRPLETPRARKPTSAQVSPTKGIGIVVGASNLAAISLAPFNQWIDSLMIG